MTRAALPYLLPFLVFSLFLMLDGWFPDQHYLLYPFKTLAVAVVIAGYWRRLPPLRPGMPSRSILVGLVGFVLWVGLDPWLVHYPAPLVGRDPFFLYPSGEAWFLFAFRVLGITLCVPILEELLWRGFLMRWLIRDDFTTVPLGTYTPFSFFVTTAFFASVHGYEWPLAVVVGLLYGAWFLRTKSLGDVMVAHGTTNFLLALYCLFSGDWHFLSLVAPAKA
jgi:CAAX prenyl protease-like protein